MKLKSPYIGIFAFVIVLLTMPLGHTAMILMEAVFGHSYIYLAAIGLGLIGLLFLVLGYKSKSSLKSTFYGLFSGLFIWTGWIEFSFVYFANRFGVNPLMMDGEVVTKPEYLIMPSSVGFLSVILLYYIFGTKSGCSFFGWIQKSIGLTKMTTRIISYRNPALTTFMELITILWTFYLVLLFVYDENFFGDTHWMTYLVAFGSLLWSLYLFIKLLKISDLSYALRYSIPTVIIFWNFVEILGRWEFFHEIWVDPFNYLLEMALILLVLIFAVALSFLSASKSKTEKLA